SHLPADRLCHQEVSLWPALDAIVEGLLGEAEKVIFTGHAGTVEQDLDMPELADGAPDRFFDGGFFCNIKLQRERSRAKRANFGGEFFGIAGTLIAYNAMSAFAGESQSDRLGARMLRARDERYSVL